jgi:hypothetical protein
MMESASEWAYYAGTDSEDREWILHPYDVWVKNPHYKGAPGTHPEEDAPVPPWTPEPGVDLLGFNLRQVGNRLAFERAQTQRNLCKAWKKEWVDSNDIPF